MAQDKTENINLGIARLEYGDPSRVQNAMLTITTGKHYDGGIQSRADVYWVGQYSRSNMIGFDGGGDYLKRLKTSGRELKATQRNIDKQHDEVFTAEMFVRLTREAREHYAGYVKAGVDAFKNVYTTQLTPCEW